MAPGRGLADAGAAALGAAAAVARSGLIRPDPPWVVAGGLVTLLRWGATPVGGVARLSARSPEGIAVIDDGGSITWRELDEASNAVGHFFAEAGLGEGDTMAIMCRNHRGFLIALLAAHKRGADCVLLNTGLGSEQLQTVLSREGARLVVHDSEFGGMLPASLERSTVQRVVADGAATRQDEAVSLPALARTYPRGDHAVPGRRGRLILLTSGTTGSPRGAARSEGGLGAAIALLSRIPLHAEDRVHIAVPIFHTWGLAGLAMALALEQTMVLRGRFDPRETVACVARHACNVVLVAPVMIRRLLALADDDSTDWPASQVRVVASSGSTLPARVSTAWMDRYGDNLYNLYGSTEVGYASIATPHDLRDAPGTAGRVPFGTQVAILDDAGGTVPPGETGRIFVGNGMGFGGYTDGSDKDRVGRLVSTGDLGRFDDEGRLFVEGREDSMIISGGENVVPEEVDRCLELHPRVVEAACVGVPDEEYGTRLRACVVVNGPTTVGELQAWVSTRQARFAVPREVVFLEALPRNATGKVVPSALRRPDSSDSSAPP